jgi:hypothetical protein
MLSSYQSIDWTKVDLVGIQAQTNTSDPSFTSTITSEVNFVRSKNPNILIFVQVNQDLDTTPNIVKAINSVKNLIDGVNMVCQACDVTTMNNLITQLRALNTPPTVPQSPTSLTASTVSSSQINLSWSAPANNGGSPVTGYKIERSSNGGSTWSLLSNTGSTPTTYSDTGLTAGTTFTYRVSAINSVGTSSTSNTVSATTTTSSSTIFANCSISGGCVADCSPPAVDPIATGNKNYDLYDGCILAGMKLAGMTQTWQGQIIKAQMAEESGISPLIAPTTKSCGGMNCGPWAVSAGAVSGDHPPGPCGSSAIDPLTGQADYSHSYGLFQSTPACDGVFGLTTSLSGYSCTPTTTADLIPFGPSVHFYCESATSISGHYIDATQDTTSPLYAKSVFNPSYQIYVYFAQWPTFFAQANSKASGCTITQQWYLNLAYWLTGNVNNGCTLTAGSSGYSYVQAVINHYQSTLYGTPWPYSFP